MRITTGKMSRESRLSHHKGWFRVFRFRTVVEIWVGDRWMEVGL